MKSIRSISIAVIIFSGLTLHALAEMAPISKNLQSLVAQLTSQYKAEDKSGRQPALSVFPLNCDTELAKKHIGFTLSELLTHEFVQTRSYIVVERSELLRSLDEQRLQQSGAIDPDKAVKIGKLIGAEVLMLGSVEEINQKLLVNARLVRVEDGKLLATAFEEIPVRVFGGATKSYTDEQTFSIYAAYNVHLKSKDTDPITTYPWADSTQVTDGKSFDMIMYGGGIRYQPSQQIVIDLCALFPRTATSIGSMTNFYSYSGNTSVYSSDISFSGTNYFRGLIGYKKSITSKINGTVSAGVGRYRFNAVSVAGATSVNVALVQFNIDFRPQPRIGFGISGNYEINAPKWEVDSPAGRQAILELNHFSWEPTISIYF